MNSGATSYEGFSTQGLYYQLNLDNFSDRPLLIFLNGLSFNTGNWSALAKTFALQRFSTLLFDFYGQGKTESHNSRFGTSELIPFDLQVSSTLNLINEIKSLHTHFPKVIWLIGTSYGAAVGMRLSRQHADQFQGLISISPFVSRLDTTWSLPLSQFDLYFPELGKPLNLAYQGILRTYMNQRFMNEIPDANLRAAAIAMSFGIMNYNSIEDAQNLNDIEFHLITGMLDTLIPQQMFDDLWRNIPQGLPRTSNQSYSSGGHVLVETHSQRLIQDIEQILKGAN